jgi:hypothetical protein
MGGIFCRDGKWRGTMENNVQWQAILGSNAMNFLNGRTPINNFLDKI